MKIVSFTGPKGSGKDSAAAILAEAKVSQGKISFAGPMKDICSRIFNIHLDVFEDAVLKELPLKKPIVLTPNVLDDMLTEVVAYLPPGDELQYDPNPDLRDLRYTIIETPRQLLQFFGTEIIRNRIHPDWHVVAAFQQKIMRTLDQNGVYCVTDARFPNEYLWLKNNFKENFIGFYVDRPEAEIRLNTATHKSELMVRNVRFIIEQQDKNLVLDNDGTLDDLTKRVLSIQFRK